MQSCAVHCRNPGPPNTQLRSLLYCKDRAFPKDGICVTLLPPLLLSTYTHALTFLPPPPATALTWISNAKGRVGPQPGAPVCGVLSAGHPPSRVFLVFQELSHWNRDPEFPRGPCCQPPAARGWLLHLESLLVSSLASAASGRDCPPRWLPSSRTAPSDLEANWELPVKRRQSDRLLHPQGWEEPRETHLLTFSPYIKQPKWPWFLFQNPLGWPRDVHSRLGLPPMSILMSHALTRGLSLRVVATAPIISPNSVKSRIQERLGR